MTMPQPLGRIGVLMGGYSSERAISLKSGTAIYQALCEEGCDVVAIDIVDKDIAKIKETILSAAIDVAFVALHGRLGEDGEIQSLLEDLQLPYVGSNAKASRLAFDKELSHQVFAQSSLAIPDYCVVWKKDNAQRAISEWKNFPVVVKPTCEGSSIGVSIIENADEMMAAMESAWEYGDRILLEQYIKGREMTVGILDKDALPVIEIHSTRGFFDYTAKYQKGLTDYLVPAPIDEPTTKILQKLALKAHQALGCANFSRVDFILSEDGTPYILEVNTIPGFTATSLLPKAAKEKGITFNQLCLTLVQLAYGKKKTKTNIPVRC
ncbi:MAG: D-alanine--D-alanine ligase [Candidatus Omnitrophica bacterium]|nr:D-alanine--D-alanine ligase [Candidatus Omnitrophota bacterium]